MKEVVKTLRNGIILHLIETQKFKTNLVASFALVDLKREEITENALIPAVLKRGTKSFQSLQDISEKLDDMYGAIFDISSDKYGNKQAIQFYVSVIDDAYALKGERLLIQSIDFLNECMFHPKLVEGHFCEDYVEQEKGQLLELIKGKINDKASYALERTLEEMFPIDPYGVYKYGKEEDLTKIDAQNLYEQYKKIVNNAQWHFYVVGHFNEEEITRYVDENVGKDVLLSFKENNTLDFTIDKSDLNQITKVKQVKDTGEVIQGKLVLAYDARIDPFSDDFYKVSVYNAMLGASATSKLFQNVREKKSMAYTIRSMYIKHKAIMLITAGIEMDKYEKALELIKNEVNDMREGNFSEDDITHAKTFLENIYKSYTDDETLIVSLSMGQFFLGKPFDVEEMIAKIKNVTRDDIIEVANKMEPKMEYYLGNNDI